MSDILLIGPTAVQAFWIWLTLGIVLLGLETFLGTQWLLWAAAASGVVAVICLTGIQFGVVPQVAVFAVLSLVMALFTRRFITAHDHADVNDPHLRMVGKQAEVLSGFDLSVGGERTGRVIFDGVEWPAILAGPADARLMVRDRVVIEKIQEGRMFVTPA